jgi:hypothetical protein
MEKIYVKLFKGGSCVSIHKGKRDNGRRRDTSELSLNEAYVEIFHKHRTDGTAQTEKQKQKIACGGRRKHKRYCKYTVDKPFNSRTQSHDCARGRCSEKKYYYG